MSDQFFPEEFHSLHRLREVAYIFDFNIGEVKTRCVELITKHIIFVTANFQLPDFYQISIRPGGNGAFWEHPEPVPRILLMWFLKNLIRELVPPLEPWYKRLIAYFNAPQK